MEINQDQIIAEMLALDPETTDSRDWPWVQEIIYQKKNFRLWAEICGRAAAMTADPILKILFLLEYINGFRRQSGLWDIQYAVRHMDETKELIENLRDVHPRKLRLLELWAYHSGWVYRSAGEFLKAADAHIFELDIAKLRKDKNAAAIASHNLQLALMEWDISQGHLDKVFFELFSGANARLLKVLSISINNANDLRWRANILCHQAWYDFLVKRQKTTKDVFQILVQTAEKLNITEFAGIYTILRACNDYLDGDFAGSLKHIGQINQSLSIYWRSYAMLLKSLALEKLGRADEAELLKSQIRELPKIEHGCHLAGAILQHNLIS